MNYFVCLFIGCSGVELRSFIMYDNYDGMLFLCLMDLGDGGSSMGSMAGECNDGKVMEWIKGRSLFKAKCVVFQ